MATDVFTAPTQRRLSPFAFLRRFRERAAADRWLAERRHAFGPNDDVRRRIAELTSRRERTLLAKSLRGAVRDAGRPGFSASPLSRRAVDAPVRAAELPAEVARIRSALEER